MLLPGDVLLTDGNSRRAALVRRITRSTWAHVAMYVGPLESGTDPCCIVEADIAAGVRAVRLSELKDPRVRILRHAGLDDLQRRRLPTGWSAVSAANTTCPCPVAREAVVICSTLLGSR